VPTEYGLMATTVQGTVDLASRRSVQPLRSRVQRCLKPLQGKAAASQTGCIYNNLGNRRLSASERIRHKGHYPLYMCEGQAGAASRISVCPAAVSNTVVALQWAAIMIVVLLPRSR
jgi:hypothetical protein